MAFDPAAFVNMLLNSATTIVTVLLVGAKVYYGLRSEMRSTREAMQAHFATNAEDHGRMEGDIKDHEVRIRVLELSPK